MQTAVALAEDAAAWAGVLVAAGVLGATVFIGSVVVSRARVIGTTQGRAEVISVSLGVGLLILIGVYAGVASRGATLYAPALVALAVAMALGRGAFGLRAATVRSMTAVIAALPALLGFSLMFGGTVAPPASMGFQALENMDVAYYAVMGWELHQAGVESIHATMRLEATSALPERNWFHWGELWLAAFALTFPGLDAMDARYVVALPVILVATGLLGGTLTRLITARRDRETFALGVVGTLSIAPVPILVGTQFDWWARPTGFSITLYGFAFVVVLLGQCLIALRRSRPVHELEPAPALIGLALVAALIASHVVIAVTVLLGSAIAFGIPVRQRPRPIGFVPTQWHVIGIAAMALAVGVWALIHGYGLGGTSSLTGVQAFDPAWRRAVVMVVLGAGVLALGSLAALAHPAHSPLGMMARSALASVAVGALIWGAGYANFNTFHAFYSAIAVVLTPVAVAGTVWLIWWARANGRRFVAGGVLGLLIAQSLVGWAGTVQRLVQFGPGPHDPIPVAALDAIRALPGDALLAYRCSTFEETVPWVPSLISITAHTGRTVVPMCYQADNIRPMLGHDAHVDIPNPFAHLAQPSAIFSDPHAEPSQHQLREFLERHRIRFIYTDAGHPDPILKRLDIEFQVGAVRVYRVADSDDGQVDVRERDRS